MKSICCIFFITISMAAASQVTTDPIVGSYYMSSGNPEGGSSLIVLSNHKFVITYFGGIQKGTWTSENGQYEFVSHVEPKFVLYGRVNPTLKDTVMLRVGVDGNRGYSVRINPLKNMPFIPVFNTDSNCYSYPYFHIIKEDLEQLDAIAPDLNEYYDGEIRDKAPDVYSFAIKERYNEFIFTGLPEQYSTPSSFTATFKDGYISIDGSQKIKKSGRALDPDSEDARFIKQHTENELFPSLLIYGNEFFPYTEEPTEADMIPFIKIEPVLHSAEGITFSEGSLFVATCED